MVHILTNIQQDSCWIWGYPNAVNQVWVTPTQCTPKWICGYPNAANRVEAKPTLPKFISAIRICRIICNESILQIQNVYFIGVKTSVVVCTKWELRIFFWNYWLIIIIWCRFHMQWFIALYFVWSGSLHYFVCSGWTLSSLNMITYHFWISLMIYYLKSNYRITRHDFLLKK